MRIKSLYIKDYNILQDFSIDFTSNISVLIGENGSGKSSIIECLAYIFGHLHKYFVLDDKTAEFIDGYKISYTISGLDVFIESRYIASETNTFAPIIKIDGKDFSTYQLKKAYADFSFLPIKVVLSYSGITERLKQLSRHFEEKIIKKIIRQNNPYSLKPLVLPSDNPFIYIKKEYVSFILLALFVLNTDEANIFLKSLGIDIYGCTTTITIKKPYWARTSNNGIWGISGKIAHDLFEGLDLFAVRTYYEENQDRLEYELYGSIMVQDLFCSCFNLDSNQVVPFLDTLLCDDLLETINITWNGVFSIDKLSEGEKQKIISVGLSLVLNKKNILFLLDEPDVSLHPKWQQNFISDFKKGLNDESMAIITTHNPIIVGNNNRDDIHIIEDGHEKLNEYYSHGRDVNSLLSDYFNMHERNLFGENLISQFYSAMTKKDYNKAENLLKDLRHNFGEGDLEVIKADSMFDDLAE
ncbi:MAG: AAA family ATPase [Prevotella sp.]|nr:AAA family ATPase [Prevotella sp.]